MEHVEYLMNIARMRDPHQPEFLQALEEVVMDLRPVFEKDAKYVKIFERLMEPERVIQFRVPWVNAKGEVQVNRAFRIEYNSAIGPYKGGLRFHPTVNMSVLKFLGFEQVFKNALTSLPIGGGKGGCDFDPKGKTDNEVMAFCQSFMTELQRHIGADTDVPAGDIGVGGREIGYMFGQYKRIKNVFEGVLTGKGLEYGGSLIRPEATGYGSVYFCQEMLKSRGMDFKGKVCVVSGAGNVAQYTIEKLLQLGAKPVTMSDSKGYIYEPEGINTALLKELMHFKNVLRKPLEEFEGLSANGKYIAGKKPWGVKCDCAFPSATQNEIDKDDAILLRDNGCIAISEGANMPSTPAAIEVYHAANMMYGLGKAANAGGVSTSGLEMTQNSMRLHWTRAEVDEKLHNIMINIHKNAYETAEAWGKKGNIQFGANIFAFLFVARAMEAQGVV